MEGYKRTFYMGIIVISLGVVLSTTMSEKVGSLGTVLIAIGGLLFIIAMNRKKKEDEGEKEKND